MLTFHTPVLADRPAVENALAAYSGRLCDLSFGCLYFWREHYRISIALWQKTLLVRYETEEGTMYTHPYGADPEGALEELIALAREQGEESLTLCNLTEAEANTLAASRAGAVARPGSRDWCDYLYPAADIVSLVGKRFSGQRNHINKFKKCYPDGHFERLDASNIPRLRAFCDAYFDGGLGKRTPVSAIEARRLAEQLEHWEAYGQLGGLLLSGGEEDRVIGFSIGEVVGDTLIIHTEKADLAFEGAYPMLVQSFARAYVNESVRFINREEDCGEPGLRTSKLSYHPCELLCKYTVRLPI